MRDQSDEQLMLDYAAGQAAAFETLYERYRAPLYRFILRQAGDAQTANDIYQGSWEKIIKARHTYRPAAPFRAWMYRIARNHLVDHFRRQPALADADIDRIISTSAGPELLLDEEQTAVALTTAIAQLPAEQRETLLLKLESGLDLKAIAEVTGVNTETAKSRLRYALAKLQPLMRGRETLPGKDHG